MRSESRNVAALGHFDDNGVVAALCQVILFQLGSQTPGLDADDGVRLRVERLSSIEDVHADRIFLERVALSTEGVVDDVTE